MKKGTEHGSKKSKGIAKFFPRVSVNGLILTVSSGPKTIVPKYLISFGKVGVEEMTSTSNQT